MGNLQTAHVSGENEENITSKLMTTWNGALSHASVNDPLVELFFKSVRNMPCTDYRCITVKKSKKDKKRRVTTPYGSKSIEDYFDAAWAVDPLRTLKFVFYLRDCRGGKGERQLFRALIRHMRESDKYQHVSANMEHIPFFGSWKDVSICFFGTSLERQAVSLIANQLRSDVNSDKPSLCAKYAPSEGGAVDKAHKAAATVARELGVSLTQYRKRYLATLRAKINVIEREMCAKAWEDIQYEKVPSLAGSRYKKAFARHDEQRYSEYLRSVQKGEKKMNTSVLMPYQMVAPYVNSKSRDETIEAQWTSFVADRKSKWPTGVNVFPLIDVSGSMFNSQSPQPGEVAIALGLLVSTLNSSPNYKGKFITFDTNPQLLSIPDGSLYEQVTYVKGTNWGGSTDVQKAFQLMLNIATTFKVPQEHMPQILLILSDMQFNAADRPMNGQGTNWQVIEDKYKAAGYKRPTIIFWNLNGNSIDYPVPSSTVPDCMLLSGFNDSIMYSLLDLDVPNPVDIVHKALDKERYDIIKLNN